MKLPARAAVWALLLSLAASCGTGGGRSTAKDDGANAADCSASTGSDFAAGNLPEVAATDPGSDAAAFIEEAMRIDALIEECEMSGDDSMVPTITSMVTDLDRRIVACARVYMDRSEEDFSEFCRRLDVDPDLMRQGFDVYGY